MSDKMPDFLKAEKPEITEDVLAKLQKLIEQYEDALAYETEAEEELKEASKRVNDLGMVQIPQLLLAYGLSEIRLANGKKVKVKEDVSVTVSDQATFHQFLRNRGEDDIVKLFIAFDRMESEKREELEAFLMQGEYEYEPENKVHPQTLRKYTRELLGVGKEDQAVGIEKGRYLRESDVTSFMRVFRIFKTKVEGGKKAKDQLGEGEEE